MRLLWTRELVSYEGRWHRVPGAGIKPLPVQQPIPVWDGGRERGGPPPRGPAAEHTVDRLLGLVREAGRDPATFGIE